MIRVMSLKTDRCFYVGVLFYIKKKSAQVEVDIASSNLALLNRSKRNENVSKVCLKY